MEMLLTLKKEVLGDKQDLMNNEVKLYANIASRSYPKSIHNHARRLKYIMAIAALLLIGFLFIQNSNGLEKKIINTQSVNATSNRNVTGQNNIDALKRQTDAKMVKRVQIVMSASDIAKTCDNITSITDRYGGYVDGSGISKENGSGSDTYLSLRIPYGKEGGLIDAIEKLGGIQKFDISREDVKNKYADAENKLGELTSDKNKLEAFSKKVTKLDDLLILNDKINSINTDIYNLKAQLEDYDLSTKNISVNIRLNDETNLALNKGFISKNMVFMKNAFFRSVNAIISIIGFLFIIASYIAAPAVLAFIIYRIYRHRSKEKLKS